MICDYQLTVRGLSIHAQSEGEGVPLLLHSGIFSEMHHWGPLIEHLHGCRVITYDAPGIGSSQVPSSPMSMRGLADIGAAILDHLGLASAHVLGVSFGGAVAQQMALSHPGRVDKLILASTSFGGMAMPGRPVGAAADDAPARLPPRPARPQRGRDVRRADEDRAGTGRGLQDVQAGQPPGCGCSACRRSPGGPACTACRRSGTRRWSCAGMMTR